MTRVRFAPSPTGNLHQGNIRTALFNYLFARHQGGKIILRIEDTDQERSQTDFEANIFADLRWLGFTFDEGIQEGGEVGPYRQSERLDLYKKSLEKLIAEQKAYACFCTADEIEVERKRALALGKSYRYQGKCRILKPEETQEKIQSGIKPSYRFKVDRDIIKFQDLVYGEKVFDTENIGDFIIARSSEIPVYLFACAVDDCLMQITHVIRGEDGMSNTPRQILIQRALGFEPPQFGHLPLILGADHTLLSKRNGSTSISELKQKGYLPQAILNYLALLGWSPPEAEEILSLDQLIQQFDLSRVARSSAIFDWGKLDHINQAHMLRMSETDYLTFAKKQLEGSSWISSLSPSELDSLLFTLRPNIKTFNDLSPWLSILLVLPEYNSEPAQEAFSDPTAKKVLESLAALLQEHEAQLKTKEFENVMEGVKKQTKLKGKKLFFPIRITLTGVHEGPELIPLMSALGKERILERIQRAIETIQHKESAKRAV